MSRETPPIRDLLRDPTDEGTADRVLRGMDLSLLARPRFPAWRLGLFVTIAVTVCVLVASWWGRERVEGPPTLRDGAPVSDLDVDAATDAPIDVGSERESEDVTMLPRVAEATAPTVAAQPAVSWRALAAGGRWREAYDALGREGFRRAARSRELTAEELMSLADVARLSRHPAEAVEPLRAVIERYPRDPVAALAAVTLGRVELDTLERPAEAARALRQAIAMGVPSSLEEDVRAKLVSALARAGDADGARVAAVAYRARFPAGRHAREVELAITRDAGPGPPRAR